MCSTNMAVPSFSCPPQPNIFFSFFIAGLSNSGASLIFVVQMSETILDSKGKRAPKSSIYTKTGDDGTTSLYNMIRHPKHSDFFDVLGAVDELSAHIGVAREHCALVHFVDTVLCGPCSA